MSSKELIKITSMGTISIPKQFRQYLELQKGDYVRLVLDGDQILIKKAVIS